MRTLSRKLLTWLCVLTYEGHPWVPFRPEMMISLLYNGQAEMDVERTTWVPA